MASKTKRSRRSFGSIRKLPSGHFQASYVYPPNSQTRHKAPTTFTGKEFAENWLAQERVAIQTGQWQSPQNRAQVNVTVAEYGRSWIEHHQLAHNTRVQWRTNLERYVFPYLGDIAVNALTTSTLKVWLQDRKKDGIAKGTISESYKALSSMMTTAVNEDELIDRNPCTLKGVHRSQPDRPPTAISAMQVRKVAQEIRPGYESTVLIAGWCGLRWGEVAGLRRKDVDLTERVLFVYEALKVLRKDPLAGTAPEGRSTPHPRAGKSHGKADYTHGPVKTEGSRRPVYIPPHIIPALQNHLNMHVGPDPDSLLFTSVRDRMRPLSGSTFHAWYKDALVKAGVTEITFHDLRHTAATLAMQTQRASGFDVRARLGHSSVRTAAHYQHVADGRHRAVGDGLSDLAKQEDPEGYAYYAHASPAAAVVPSGDKSSTL